MYIVKVNGSNQFQYANLDGFDSVWFIYRPVDTPQSYNKGPQPPPAASPQSYRVPAREASIRYVQQNPYGTMQVSKCSPN